MQLRFFSLVAVAASETEVRRTSVICTRSVPKAAMPKCREAAGIVAAGNRKGGIAAGRMPQATQKGGAAADNSAKRKDLLQQQQKMMPPMAAKGFNFVSAKPPLRRAESRFAEPRSSLQGNGLSLFAACKKYRKNTPRVATLWTPGDDSKLCRKYFWRSFRRHVSNPAFRTKRRRKGFESVRKGSSTADAKLLFFEKGLLYCKLTAASAIQKGLLHVSFGAVES